MSTPKQPTKPCGCDGRTVCLVHWAHRFWNKADRRSNSECWVWTAARNVAGYGQCGVAGMRMSAHRVAWILAGNSLSPEDCILHSCDNPPCVNPAHMRIGTHLENAKDRESRGRGIRRPRRGASATAARLTWEQVTEIRARYAAGERGAHLARAFGVGGSTLRHIVNWDTWKVPA